MRYYIAYKGKPYGAPLSKEEAELKLIVLSKSFDGLTIVQEDEADESDLTSEFSADASSSGNELIWRKTGES